MTIVYNGSAFYRVVTRTETILQPDQSRCELSAYMDTVACGVRQAYNDRLKINAKILSFFLREKSGDVFVLFVCSEELILILARLELASF